MSNSKKSDKKSTCSLVLCTGDDMMDDHLAGEQLPQVVDDIVASLDHPASPDHVGCPTVPSRDCLALMVDLFEKIVFPGYFGTQEVDRINIRYYLGSRIHRLYRILSEQITRCLRHTCPNDEEYCRNCRQYGREQALEILRRIPHLRGLLATDVEAAYKGDPAATSHEEIIFCYPGLKVVTIYRFAHELYIRNIPIIPRMLAEFAHSATGCDIHPGATIGKGFFIDHATGVVIGETAVIGDNVRIYQGVTLGGLSYRIDENGRLSSDSKRHPTLEDDVVVYANATILGGRTVIGNRAVIGGNVWVTQSVPADAKVLHNPKGNHIITEPARPCGDAPAGSEPPLAPGCPSLGTGRAVKSGE